MADDDDAIYVDVVPRLDENAADEIESTLRGKLSHIGDSVKDALSGAFDSIGDHLGGAGGFGDKLHDILSTTLEDTLSGKEWDNIGQKAGTALGRGVADSLKDLTHGDFGNILGNFDHFGDVLGGALNKLSDRLDGLQKAGGALGNVLSGSGSGSDITDIIGGAKDLGFKIPGPLNNISHAKDVIDQLNQHPGKAEDWLSSHIPGVGTLENILEKGPQDLGGKIHDWFTDAPAKSPVSDAASDKWSSSVAGAIDISTQDAVISAGTVSLGGSISIPGLGVATGGASSGLASSLGGSHSTSTGIAAAGSDSGFGSLYSSTSVLGKGFAQGGVLPGDSPGYDNMIGVLPSGKAVGLEGGEGVISPYGMSKSGAGDIVAMLNSHFDEGTTSVPMDPQNPTLFVPPTQGNKGGPPQQQQLGTGSGAGISGGGIIGAAEQAAVSAAGIAGFGGGAIAAQMAEQEINLAIQKGSQAAAALAAAPFETFGLAGGQMGAPTVNPMGGWIGKFISGALGQMSQIPNVAGGAGSVQPPKPPKQPGQEDGQGQGEKVSMGPSGSKDDPYHVKSVDGPAQPPQGGMTSAANMVATMAPLTA